MTKKYLVLTFGFIFLLSHNARADFEINFKADISQAKVSGLGHQHDFLWTGLEMEFEKNWHGKKFLPSGVALGLRKETTYLNEGDYFTLRIFKMYKLGGWQVIPSVTGVYGLPGIYLDKTEQTLVGNQASYVHYFPVRSREFPVLTKVNNAGILYPEIAVGFRKNLGILRIEPVVGMRLMRFGIVQSDYHSGTYQDKLLIVPSVGLRLGIKL